MLEEKKDAGDKKKAKSKKKKKKAKRAGGLQKTIQRLGRNTQYKGGQIQKNSALALHRANQPPNISIWTPQEFLAQVLHDAFPVIVVPCRVRLKKQR